MKQATIAIGRESYIIAELPEDALGVTVHDCHLLNCSKVVFSSKIQDPHQCGGDMIPLGKYALMIGPFTGLEENFKKQISEGMIAAGLHLANPAGDHCPMLCPGDEQGSLSMQGLWEASEPRTFRPIRSYVFQATYAVLAI